MDYSLGHGPDVEIILEKMGPKLVLGHQEECLQSSSITFLGIDFSDISVVPA